MNEVLWSLVVMMLRACSNWSGHGARGGLVRDGNASSSGSWGGSRHGARGGLMRDGMPSSGGHE